MRSNVKMFGLCAGVLALMLTNQVSAAGKKGPRASLLSSTECALDLNGAGAFLEVKTMLKNKSSGDTVPVVRSGQIEATYKPQDQRGNVNITFNNSLIEDLEVLPTDVDPVLTITAEFPLCDEFGVLEEVRGARELNGKATVMYGISSADGETRVVTNRCTDDRLTLDVDEGAIKVDDITFSAIEAACSP